MGIFDKRKEYKPFEYPEFVDLKNRLRKTFWTDDELTFEGDKVDFHNLNPQEQEIVKRTLTLISTIEVQVKDFWGQLGSHFPKPEISNVGATAAESEVRHSDSYDRLLDILGLQDYYKKALEIEAIKGRFSYLDKYLKLSAHNSDNKKYILKLILFSILIENVSLFSNFATLMYLYRHRGIMKDIRNIVKWSSVDEALHFNIGVTVINIVRREFPEMFNEDFQKQVHEACSKSIYHEKRLLNWVFEKGELDNMSKLDLENYMKYRVDDSLQQLGFDKLYNEPHPERLKFFYEEVFADSQDDFLAIRPVDYTLKDMSITGDDLF